MNDYRQPPREPLPRAANGLAGTFGPLPATLPAGAFTASVLFDVLSLFADNPQQAQSYKRGAAEFLTVGLSSVIASVALELVEDLRAPEAAADPAATRRFAVNGAIVAVYLLDVAARRKPGGESPKRDTIGDVVPIGLSLLGLMLLGISAKRK